MDYLPNKQNTSHYFHSTQKEHLPVSRDRASHEHNKYNNRIDNIKRIFDQVPAVMNSSDICFQYNFAVELRNIKPHLFACTMNGWKSQ